LLSLAFASTAFAGCWEISLPEQTLVATEIWQIRGTGDGLPVLIGNDGENSRAISLSRVQSVRVTDEAEGGHFSSKRNQRVLDIQLLDGPSLKLSSELSLYYIADKKRRDLPLARIKTIMRCAGEPATNPEESTTTALATVSTKPFIYLRSGEIVRGKILNSRLHWHSSYAVLVILPTDIRSLRMAIEGAEAGVLLTRAGDKLFGSLNDASLSIELTGGQIVEIGLSDVERIESPDN